MDDKDVNKMVAAGGYVDGRTQYLVGEPGPEVIMLPKVERGPLPAIVRTSVRIITEQELTTLTGRITALENTIDILEKRVAAIEARSNYVRGYLTDGGNVNGKE